MLRELLAASRGVILQLACACLVANSMLAQSADSSVVKVVRSARDAILLIETFDADGRPLGTGTGFFVDSLGTVVTNHHVVTGATTARVLNSSRESFQVVGWIRTNPEVDLATLKIQSAGPTPWLRLGNTTPPEPGTQVVVIGSPRGLAQTVTTGISSGLQEVEGKRMLQVSALASPGSSGSPVLDASAKVRGVIAAIRSDAPQVVYAVSGFDLGALLAERDTVKALATVPAGAPMKARAQENAYAAPQGLTHMYQFQSLVGYPFAYVWLVESPSGALSGAAFIQHATGFVDVVPIQTGTTPGRRRAFQFQAGCGVFEGWIRDQGLLAGDVANTCHGGTNSPFQAVPFGTPPGQRRNKVRPIRQYLVRTPTTSASTDSATWAWVTAVTPKDLGEGTVGAMHLWGDILGRPRRMDLTFGRGRSDSTSLTLATTDESIQLSVVETNGTITGMLTSASDTNQRVALEGYRDDLTYCFGRVESKARMAAEIERLTREDRVLQDSIAAVITILGSPNLAGPPSAPLGAVAAVPASEKERTRLAARAPYDSLLAVLVTRRNADINLREMARKQLELLAQCPLLPSEAQGPDAVKVGAR